MCALELERQNDVDKLGLWPFEIGLWVGQTATPNRMGVKGKDRAKVDRFGTELVPLVTSGPPGVTGFAGGRPKATEIIGFWPALLRKEFVQPTVELF